MFMAAAMTPLEPQAAIESVMAAAMNMHINFFFIVLYLL